MNQLSENFITTERPYKEGTVEVFEQIIPAKGVESAELTITALGVYCAYLNGRKVGKKLFTPGYTYYPLDLQYDTYDVTDELKESNV